MTALRDAISVNKAMDLMRRGSALVRSHGRISEWWVVPGGRVTDATAAAIQNHPLIKGQQDTLFPGMDQTWRMVGKRA